MFGKSFCDKAFKVILALINIDIVEKRKKILERQRNIIEKRHVIIFARTERSSRTLPPKDRHDHIRPKIVALLP